MRPVLFALLALAQLPSLPAHAGDPAEVRIGERLFTQAEIDEGAALFDRKCSQCHGLDGVNYKGPWLNGVIDRPSASVPGWDYSPAMKGWGGVWTVENLQTYLTKPVDFIPDVAMNFGGFRSKTEDRDKVIAYLILMAATQAEDGQPAAESGSD
jgi:cytochrome c